MKQEDPSPLRHLEQALEALRAASLLRERPLPCDSPGTTFCSNDYLGLASASGPSPGAGASRLIVGERPEHTHLETLLAGWLRVESSLLFTSGYAANVGTISALASKHHLVISDELNHASIIDGCRLSGAEIRVVPHLDLDAVDAALRRDVGGRKWVVTESYFSMDADSADLRELRRICNQHDAALIVDEAHALGIFGPEGRGVCAAQQVRPDVLIGGLGKAFGSGGGFVAGRRVLTEWLWNRARSFVFSTGLSPLLASAIAARFASVAGDSAHRDRLHRNARHMRAGLDALGLKPLGYGPIIPLVIGDAEATLGAAAALKSHGLHTQAIRPPTVPPGTARLRFTVTALHSTEHIEAALRALARCIQWLLPSRR